MLIMLYHEWFVGLAALWLFGARRLTFMCIDFVREDLVWEEKPRSFHGYFGVG